jgi:hypothetical protein
VNDGDMKRVGIVAGAVLLGGAVLNHAYQAGLAAGLMQSGRVTAVAPVDGVGFFPFPPFPLLLIGGFLFLMWRRRQAGGGPWSHGRGPGRGGPPRIFEDWHRQAHEGNGGPASTATPTPTPAPTPTEQPMSRGTETTML